MKATAKDLRRQAISASLFEPTTLGRAITRLGFVQADPIRAPAPAQDLILRHRVEDYRIGDLDREYPRLNLEEGRLYAHGFLPRSTWRLLHPPQDRTLTAIERHVLEFAADRKRLHPRDLESPFGRAVERNDWGGRSKATTRVLHRLHFWGLRRVARRENGVRVYAPITDKAVSADPTDRLRQLALRVAQILGPLPDGSLRKAISYMAFRSPELRGAGTVVKHLVDSGELAGASLDGIRYVWPATPAARQRPNRTVRFLAPFDPIVWDRLRFEHLWGWSYRFEAYVPGSKRKLGYYAMPLLWRDDLIGWVNASRTPTGVNVEPGFVKTRPREQAFQREYDAEAAGLETFLRPKNQSKTTRRD